VDELATNAFVSCKLTVGIDLTLDGVENVFPNSDGFKLRVADVSKKAMDLKLLERVEPLLSGIIEHVFGMYDANIVIRKFRRVGVLMGERASGKKLRTIA
jgi:hypothetical protein